MRTSGRACSPARSAMRKKSAPRRKRSFRGRPMRARTVAPKNSMRILAPASRGGADSGVGFGAGVPGGGRAVRSWVSKAVARGVAPVRVTGPPWAVSMARMRAAPEVSSTVTAVRSSVRGVPWALLAAVMACGQSLPRPSAVSGPVSAMLCSPVVRLALMGGRSWVVEELEGAVVDHG